MGQLWLEIVLSATATRGKYFLPLIFHPTLLMGYAAFFLLHYCILIESFCEKNSNLIEVVWLEICGISSMVKIPLKRCFQGKTIHDVEFSPQNHSRGFEFGFFNSELAGEETKHLALFRH